LGHGGRFVLLTGDPLADPQFLSQALCNVEGAVYAVIEIHCGPELKGKDVALAAPRFTGPRRRGGTLAVPKCSATASPLFIFVDFDLLSDRQIGEVCESALGGDRFQASGVLLAPLEFAAQLERPALHFLKERLAAHFCVQEVGDDEVIPFLHNQLLAQRDRRSEARGFRRGVLIGLAASGLLIAAGTGALLRLHPTVEQVYDVPSHPLETSSVSDQTMLLRLGKMSAMSAEPVQAAPEIGTVASAPTSPPLSAATAREGDSLSPIAPSAPAQPPNDPGLSTADMGALVERGDALFSVRDISSARLYYKRAAEAGDGLAALRLGASFDPEILERAGVRGVTGDPALALSWYRRARDLGMVEAEHRIKSLETSPLGKANTLSH
jgi:hypothetical protein